MRNLYVVFLISILGGCAGSLLFKPEVPLLKHQIGKYPYANRTPEEQAAIQELATADRITKPVDPFAGRYLDQFYGSGNTSTAGPGGHGYRELPTNLWSGYAAIREKKIPSPELALFETPLYYYFMLLTQLEKKAPVEGVLRSRNMPKIVAWDNVDPARMMLPEVFEQSRDKSNTLTDPLQFTTEQLMLRNAEQFAQMPMLSHFTYNANARVSYKPWHALAQFSTYVGPRGFVPFINRPYSGGLSENASPVLYNKCVPYGYFSERNSAYYTAHTQTDNFAQTVVDCDTIAGFKRSILFNSFRTEHGRNIVEARIQGFSDHRDGKMIPGTEYQGFMVDWYAARREALLTHPNSDTAYTVFTAPDDIDPHLLSVYILNRGVMYKMPAFDFAFFYKQGVATGMRLKIDDPNVVTQPQYTHPAHHWRDIVINGKPVR